MEVRLISDRGDHPVLNAVLSILDERNETRTLEVPFLDDATIGRELAAPADVYLLKSRSPAALEFGRELERRGATLLNGTAATYACLDRVLMASRLAEAGVDAPRTQAFPSVRRLREDHEAGQVEFPSLVKSRHSRRGDLVRRLDRGDELVALGPEWDQEPIVLQEFIDGDGWDWKLWVIGDAVHAARRRTVLITGATGAQKRSFPIAAGDLPDEWRQIASRVGGAFGLELFGVDLLPTERGQVVVDVNAFPGFRSVPDAPAQLAELIQRHAMTAAGSG